MASPPFQNVGLILLIGTRYSGDCSEYQFLHRGRSLLPMCHNLSAAERIICFFSGVCSAIIKNNYCHWTSPKNSSLSFKTGCCAFLFIFVFLCKVPNNLIIDCPANKIIKTVAHSFSVICNNTTIAFFYSDI